MSDNTENAIVIGRLTVIRGGVEGQDSFEFIAPAIVGRFDPSVGPVDIDMGTIPEGSYVSRKHARFDLGDNGFTLTDLESSNGTYVLRGDFEKIETAELSHGDQISFGNARFVFHIVQPDYPSSASANEVESESDLAEESLPTPPAAG